MDKWLDALEFLTRDANAAWSLLTSLRWAFERTGWMATVGTELKKQFLYESLAYSWIT